MLDKGICSQWKIPTRGVWFQKTNGYKFFATPLIKKRGDMVSIPFPEIRVNSCSSDHESTEVTVCAFWGKVIKVHVPFPWIWGMLFRRTLLLKPRCQSVKCPSYNPAEPKFWVILASVPGVWEKKPPGDAKLQLLGVLLAESPDTPEQRPVTPTVPRLRPPEPPSMIKELGFTPLGLG